MTDAEAVMEDAETKVEMPVDLLPTPRVDEEMVEMGDVEGVVGGGEEDFDQQLKMLNSTELEAKDLTVGKRKGGRGAAIAAETTATGTASKSTAAAAAAAAAATTPAMMEGGATIRDLEKKGEGKTKSFKFTVDLDFASTGSSSSSSSRNASLKAKESKESIGAESNTAKDGGSSEPKVARNG